MTPENTLAQVRYCDWDVMRGMLYDVFGWYMQNLTEIGRLANFEADSEDEFIRHCLERGLKSYQDQYEGIKRGDEV